MKKRNNKKKGSQSNFSKLSVFQNNKYKFKKNALYQEKVHQSLIIKILSC